MKDQLEPGRRVALRRALLAAGTTLLGLAAACSDTAPTTPTSRLVARTPLFSATTLTSVPILWDQSTFVGGHGHAHSGTRHADDFIIPAGAQWSISQLMLAADHPYL